MPIGPELLNPIPGPNASGENLRYAAVYEKIKEARREEDEVPQGDWQREIKRADPALVLKLCTDALTNKSKDLQLAAWLTEALVRKEGFAGLRQGLELCKGLVGNFWDTLYPELEDGDAELRATPLDWIGSRLEESLKKVPLTKSGLDWYQYKESRSIGYEQEASQNEAKRQTREQAISDGKITAEDFDKALTSTAKVFYEQKLAEIDGCIAAVEGLSEICDQRFGDFRPSFANLRDTLGPIRQVVTVLLGKKREREPEERPADVPAEMADAAPEEPPEAPVDLGSSAGAAVAPARVRKPPAVEPSDRGHALEQVAAIAAYLRKQNSYDPVPYLLLRAVRWGELRTNGSDIDANQLEAPATEMRQQLKRLANESNWEELIGLIEMAMAMPCGRAWLDLQRYFAQACDQASSSYEPAKNAVLSELKALLADYPSLPHATLTDDTPTANADTQAWLQNILPSRAEIAGQATEPLRVQERPTPELEPAAGALPPDAYELAIQAARAGRTDEAIEILTREAAQEGSGRARFQRRIQLAQVCMGSGYEGIAYPILEELATEVEQRKLEDWETHELVVRPLVMLFRCMTKLKENPERKQQLYARICRLDALAGMELVK